MRPDVAQRGLERLDADALRDLDLDLGFIDLGHLADDAAAGDDNVVLLHRSDHRLVLLHPALLRADEQEVEDDEDEDQREDRHEEPRGSSRGCGACRGESG